MKLSLEELELLRDTLAERIESCKAELRHFDTEEQKEKRIIIFKDVVLRNSITRHLEKKRRSTI